MPRSQLIRFRRGTTAEWAASTQPLAEGEPGWNTDTGQLRVGDGESSFAGLPDAAVPNALYLPAGVFGLAAGSAAIGPNPANRKSGWLLDAAQTERLDTTTVIPDEWATMTADILWANAGAGTGNVRLTLSRGPFAQGTDLSGFPSGGGPSLTVAAGAQSIAQVSTTSAFSAAPGPSTVWIERAGADAADTLANDIVFYGLVLRRAS